MSKVRFQVVYASGEDQEYPAEELNAHSPHTKGWQSPRFCDYPQELGLEMENRAHLTRVQILSHQSKIAAKIELFVGDGPSYEQAKFERLGYLSLNNNQRSNYQARELKSVYIDATGRYIKLLISRCYINKYNLFNQVGIIAVNLIGENAEGGRATSNHHHPLHVHNNNNHYPTSPTTSTSRGGAAAGGGTKSKPSAMDDISFEMNYDPETARRIREIAMAKEQAVEIEDYDTAKRLKGAEAELKLIGGQIAELEVAKRQAVGIEDYDRAKALKAEIDVIRRQIDHKLAPYLDSSTSQQRQGGPPSSSSQDYYYSQQQQQQQQHDQAEGPPSVTSSADSTGMLGGGNRPEVPTVHHLHHDDEPVSTRGIGPSSIDGLAMRTAGTGIRDEEAPIVVRGAGGVTMTDTGVGYRPKSREIKSVPTYHEGGGSGGEGSSQEGDGHEEGGGGGGGGGHVEESGRYHGDGPHPLEGVPNYEELPAPEPLGKVPGLEPSEVQTVVALFGEYLSACLFSKTWQLRDAALTKVKLMTQRDLNVGDALRGIVHVLKVGIDDKIAQVFMSTLGLLETTMEAARSAGLKRSQVGPMMEPVVALLILKLGDGQARIREAVLTALSGLSRASSVGPAALSHYALRKMPKKQLSSWRAVHARVMLLKKLVEETRLASGCGLTADSVMTFAKDVNAFVHSSGEVRDAARELTVSVYEVIGKRVLRYIEPVLRKKQMDEYEEAFRRTMAGEAAGDDDESSTHTTASATRGGGGGGGHHHTASPRGSPPLRSGRMTETGAGGDGGAGGGTAKSGRMAETGGVTAKSSSSSTSRHSPKHHAATHKAAGAGQPDQHHVEESGDFEESTDFTCQFCGKYDPSFTEDALDHHYFVDCPLLMRCMECGQVIEIVSLAEHLLTECDAKAQYEACPRSSLAVRKSEMKSWKEGPYFKPKPTGNATRCPLCYSDIRPNTEESIKGHYLKKCAANPRMTTSTGGGGAAAAARRK